MYIKNNNGPGTEVHLIELEDILRRHHYWRQNGVCLKASYEIMTIEDQQVQSSTVCVIVKAF